MSPTADAAAVDEGGLAAAVAARDDVGGGEQVAVGRDHHRAAAPVQAPAASGAVGDAEVRDRRSEPLGHADHGARVGVEGLGLVDAVRRRAAPLGAEARVDEGQVGDRAKLATRLGVAAGPRVRFQASAQGTPNLLPEAIVSAKFARVCARTVPGV